MEKIQFNEPDNPEIILALADSYIGLERFSKAIKYLERYRLKHPDTIDVLNKLAACYHKENMQEQAISVWRRSLELDSTQSEVQKLLDTNINKK